MTDVWEISQRRIYSYEIYCSYVELASEFKILLYFFKGFNPTDAVMISTLISFDDLHNINVCLRYGNMNGYVEAPG